MTIFFSRRPVIEYVLYDPFYTAKTTISEKKRQFFYSVHPFAHIRQHYFSKYWEDQCMGRPPPQIFFGGTVPPRSPPLHPSIHPSIQPSIDPSIHPSIGR